MNASFTCFFLHNRRYKILGRHAKLVPQMWEILVGNLFCVPLQEPSYKIENP